MPQRALLLFAKAGVASVRRTTRHLFRQGCALALWALSSSGMVGVLESTAIPHRTGSGAAKCLPSTPWRGFYAWPAQTPHAPRFAASFDRSVVPCRLPSELVSSRHSQDSLTYAGEAVAAPTP